MKTKHALLLDIAIIIGIVWGLIAFNGSKYTDQIDMKADTVFVHDTILDTVPQPVEHKVTDYIKIPVFHKTEDTTQNHIRDKPDTLSVIDSSYIVLPITQTKYKGKSYEAWVSGYRANLDSIHIIISTPTILKTVTRHKKNKWGLGIQAGCGYINNRPQPYLGIGLQYNIFSW